MSKLKEYLFFKRRSISSFADEVQINRSYMTRIVNRNIKPSRFLAKEIERATGGEITAEYLRGDEP
jgi:DNA-binding transcriptional regulator YdaS (Cro superfamily)